MSNGTHSAILDVDRLAALRELGLLDTPAEEAFDRLARLAARLLKVPIALVSLVDADRQFFKSCLGLPEPWASWRETPLSHSFCQHVVATCAPLIIGDARTHPNLRDNLAIRDLNVIAYLGIPLTLPNGYTVGSFCVFDSVPRAWTPLDIETVRDFAAAVMSEIALHRRRSQLEEGIARRATELEETQQALSRSHAQTHAAEFQITEILERITDGFVALDKGWYYTYINRRGAEMLGRKPNELLGKFIWSQFPQDLGQPFRAAYERAMHSQVPVQFEDFYPPWNRWFSNNIYPSPAGLSIFYQDISERKFAEARLQENEQRLRLALHAGHMGIFDWDVVQNVIVWSPEHAQLFGMHVEDFDGRYETFARRVHPDDLGRIEQAVAAARTNQGLYQEEYRIVWPDGSTHWVASQGQFFYDAQGKSLRMSGVVQNIDARKLAEDKAILLAQRIQFATDAAALGIWDWDLTTDQWFATPTCFTMLGDDAKNGDNSREYWNERMHPQDRPRVEAQIAALLGGGPAPYHYEARLRHADGSYRWIHVSGRVLATDAGVKPTRMLGVCIDITDRKLTEASLRLLTQELEARVLQRTEELAQTNTELETFSYTVSHDLRAPLRAMQGFARALLEDYAQSLDARAQDYVRRLASVAERMDGLIQDLLAYSHLSRAALKAQHVELDSAVSRAREQVAADITSTGATVQVISPLPAIRAHSATLVQAIANLLTNAIKFMPPDVRPAVIIRPETRGDWVRLWVQDNGIGIEQQYHERIYRVFERLHGIETYPGTGIGLAIVRKAIERMGGSTGVESQPGQGSHFWIELPASQGNSNNG